MRIDMLMNKLCLVKTRSIAKKAFDKNLITLNGKTAKAASLVNAGDILEFSLAGWQTTVKITEIPNGNVAKKDSPTYYEVIDKKKLVIPQE